MADALGSSDNIFQGLWTDWSKGGIWGLTWTLSPTHATLVTNSMTLFVSITGMQLWSIIRYSLHQMRPSSRQGMPTPHLRSEQVILRNASSDLETARQMLCLACTSRKKSTGRRSLRSYSIGLFALLYAGMFMTAATFSNRAISAISTNGGSAVLSRSKDCGMFNESYLNIANGNYSTEEEFGLFTQYAAKRAHDVELSLEYALACYLPQPSTSLSSTCHSFKTSKLLWQPLNGSCPFDEQLCQKGTKVVVFETDYIDSHGDLGINAEPHDRLRYRRKTTCAVLNGTGHVRGWDGAVVNTSTSKPSTETAYAYYGPSLYKDTDFTYSYSNFASFYTNFTAQVTLPYQLDSERAMGVAEPQWTISDFDPIPGLAQEQADLVLFFLSYIGKYLGKVDDPWFAAHREQWIESSYAFLEQRYARDLAITTLGCAEQHEFCLSNNTCTGLGGFDQIQNVYPFNGSLSPKQAVTFDRLLRAVDASGIWNVVLQLAITTTPLLASNATMAGGSGAVLSLPLPDNQFETELEYWHSIAMAQLQRTVVQWATGQIAADPQYLVPAETEDDVWFCNSLIVPSTVYQSFCLVALVLVVASGTLVIVVSVTIERLAASIRKYFGSGSLRRDWDLDNMLELQPSVSGRLWGSRRSASDNTGLSVDEGNESSERIEPKPITTTPTKYRISSKVLSLNTPTFSSMNGLLITRSDGSQERQEPPPRPVRDSGLTIGLSNLDFTLSGTPTSLPNADMHQTRSSPTVAQRSTHEVRLADDREEHIIALAETPEDSHIQYPAPSKTRHM
ncbi:hypothetical protein LTS15_008493 [Exophiala xenobiotica]|nr:hypothetical protein LTS15_008493 [Exophiala xenobiotica]